jgi:deferrochelatase/peroxidase EfeB
METARQQDEGFSGVTVLLMQDFGAQPGNLNPLGYRDSIGQPAIQGSGVESLPGQADRSKRANSSSAIRGRPVCRCRCHSRGC